MIVTAWIVGVAAALLVLLSIGLALFSAWTARRVEKLLPPPGRFIDVDGATLHYLDEGSGPPLLLIHGLAGQTRVFTHSLLDRLTSEHRVIILDRPGSGYSTRPARASAAVSAQAATIARFIEAIGVEQPLVVGHRCCGDWQSDRRYCAASSPGHRQFRCRSPTAILCSMWLSAPTRSRPITRRAAADC